MRWLATWIVAMSVAAAAVDRRPDPPRRTWPPTGDPLRFNPTVAPHGVDPATAWRVAGAAAALAVRPAADPSAWAAAIEDLRRIRAGARGGSGR